MRKKNLGNSLRCVAKAVTKKKGRQRFRLHLRLSKVKTIIKTVYLEITTYKNFVDIFLVKRKMKTTIIPQFFVNYCIMLRKLNI